MKRKLLAARFTETALSMFRLLGMVGFGACGAYSGKAEATDRGRICRACVSAC